MKENQKIGIFESVALFSGILSLCMMALPAYWETGKDSITLLQMVFGNDRLDFNSFLLLGMILLIIGSAVAAIVAVICFTKKSYSEKTLTILGIVSGIFFLASAIILALGIIITGLDKENSELGLIQGNWGIGIGNILVPLFGFISFVMSYPASLIILHHKDLKDKKK